MADNNPEQELPKPHYEKGLPIFPSPQDKAKAEEQAKERGDKSYKDRQIALDSRMVFFTGALFICSLITGGINCYQSWVANKSADAAKTSAETAQKTLTHSIEAFRVDERSWVVIGSIDKTPLIVTGHPSRPEAFIYKIWLKNVGKTVARNVHVLVTEPVDTGMLMFSEQGIRMTQDQLFRQNDDPSKRSITPYKNGPQTIAPGATAVAPIEANSPYIGSFQYVIGRIDYFDAFNTSHWTHFCFSITGGGELAYCQYGNDDDNNPEPNAP
jgi:hypothetical protein